MTASDIPVCVGVGGGGWKVTVGGCGVCEGVESPVFVDRCVGGGGAADAGSWEVAGCAKGDTIVSDWLSEVNVPLSTLVLSTRQYFVSRSSAN